MRARSNWLAVGAVAMLVAVSAGTMQGAAGGALQGGVAVEAVAFDVTDAVLPGTTYTLHGDLMRPADAPACGSAVLVLVHGLSYARWAWDFPLRPDTYAMARALAQDGHAVLAIDAPGSGQSDGPNGRLVTGETNAVLLHQVVQQLRAGTYHGGSGTPFGHVGLAGHSAGGDMIEAEAGLFGDADVLIPMAWHHQGAPETTPEETAVLLSGMVLGDHVTLDPAVRAALFYSDAGEDDVIALDNALSEPVASGWFLSTGFVPGGASLEVMPRIEVPVLLMLAEKDRIFHTDFADTEMALFASAADKTLHIVPDAGHSFMLHPNAPATTAVVDAWLDAHPAQMPAC